MHKSEHRVNPTLINHANMVYELKARTNKTRKCTSSLKINSETDLTSQYRESTALQYLMHISTRHQVLSSMTYYPLHADPP